MWVVGFGFGLFWFWFTFPPPFHIVSIVKKNSGTKPKPTCQVVKFTWAFGVLIKQEQPK